jgi:hypothetical protein
MNVKHREVRRFQSKSRETANHLQPECKMRLDAILYEVAVAKPRLEDWKLSLCELESRCGWLHDAWLKFLYDWPSDIRHSWHIQDVCQWVSCIRGFNAFHRIWRTGCGGGWWGLTQSLDGWSKVSQLNHWQTGLKPLHMAQRMTYFVDVKYFTYVSAVLKDRNTSSGLYTWADVKLRPWRKFERSEENFSVKSFIIKSNHTHWLHINVPVPTVFDVCIQSTRLTIPAGTTIGRSQLAWWPLISTQHGPLPLPSLTRVQTFNATYTSPCFHND